MYSKLSSCVKIVKKITECFMSHIGTRQGCPLSLYLFNLFINDIPSVLNKYKGNSVKLDFCTLNVFMYADHTVFLSESFLKGYKPV